MSQLGGEGELQSSAAWGRRAPSALAATTALLSLAAALRFGGLDSRGLWYDEAFSVAMSRLDLPDMVRATAADIHPPLYYALLKGWMLLFGAGEVALRALSAVLGVLGVYLVYRLGVEIGGRRLGYAAGLAAAISPFLVLYAQETRMYTLLVAGVTAAAIFAWRAVNLHPPRQWVVGYVVASVVAAYAHNTAPFATIGFNVAYLVLAGPSLLAAWRGGSRHARSSLGAWVGCQVAVLLLFAPWLVVLWEQSSRYVKDAAPVGVWPLFEAVGRAFTVGEVPAAGVAWAGLLGWGLALLGLVLPLASSRGHLSRDRRALGAAFAASWLVAGFVVLYLNLAGKRDFSPRYIAVVLPAFYLLLAVGLLELARLKCWLFGVGLVAILTPVLLSLGNYYQDPYDDRPDHRGPMATIAALAQPGDVVVLDAPYLKDVYAYYARPGIPGFGLPVGYPPDGEATRSSLADIASRAKRIWLVLWQSYYADPEAIVQSWLRDNTAPAFAWSYYMGVELRGYDVRAPGDTVFGGTVKLEGVEIIDFKAGWEVKARLRWRCLAPPGQDYQVFVHLVDDAYRFYGQHDGGPNGGNSPTSRWKAGDLIQDEHVLRIPEDAAGRELQLRVGLYSLADGKRLTSTVGDSLLLFRGIVAGKDAP